MLELLALVPFYIPRNPVSPRNFRLTDLPASARPLKCPRQENRRAAGPEMTSRGIPSRFLQSVLHNGLGRFVPQLKRVSIVFSRKGQSSLGVR